MEQLQLLAVLPTLNLKEVTALVTKTDKALLEEEMAHINTLLASLKEGLDKKDLEQITIKRDALLRQVTQFTETELALQKETFQKIRHAMQQLYELIKDQLQEQGKLTLLKESINQKVVILNQALKTVPSLSEEQQNLYQQITTNQVNLKQKQKDIEKLISLLATVNESSSGPTMVVEPELFTKLNDRIVNASFTSLEDKIAAKYTLEDGSFYYAVVEKEKEVLEKIKEFAPITKVELTTPSLKETLERVLKNAQLYYELNEYMRYIELSSRKKMTPSIDQLLLSYKQQLAQMETELKKELQFFTQLAPVLHGKESATYQGLHYQGAPLTTFYQDNTSELASLKHHLLIDIIASETEEKPLLVRSILESIYGQATVQKLPSLEYLEEEKAPITTSKVINNKEKIENYLAVRLKELEMIATTDLENVTITREDNTLYQHINTFLDLRIAALISDKVYKEGQGLFAIEEYVTNKKATRFTSQYGARELALQVNPAHFMNLLLENLLKQYFTSCAFPQEKKSSFEPLATFIEQELQMGLFPIDKLSANLVAQRSLLTKAIDHFEVAYLNPFSQKSQQATTAREWAKEQSSTLLTTLEALLQRLHQQKLPLSH